MLALMRWLQLYILADPAAAQPDVAVDLEGVFNGAFTKAKQDTGLPCPALPCPALPCPALPCPALPCPVLPCPALPCPALPCPAHLAMYIG